MREVILSTICRSLDDDMTDDCRRRKEDGNSERGWKKEIEKLILLVICRVLEYDPTDERGSGADHE
jgi:hypothetical protein